MTRFDIRIAVDNGDLALYPEAASISINDGTVEVDCGENGTFTHQLDQTNEIRIVTNR